MTGNLFSLAPLPSGSVRHNLIISGNVERTSNILNISFLLAGPLSEIAIPSASDIPCRKKGLWEETCFELFLGLQNAEEYREFNFSPAGHWNVYRFTAYRQGKIEEPSFASLPFSVHRHPDALQLFIEISLDNFIETDQLLRIGVSAVVKYKDGRITYWALTHPGPQPDFHDRNSFIIEL